MLGKIRGKSCAGEDEVRTGFDGSAHKLAEVGERHHDVDADKPLGLFPGLQYFPVQGTQVGSKGILGHILVEQANHGCSYDSYAAFIGNCRG